MSTIEKAAARLVAKPRPVPKEVGFDEEAPLEPDDATAIPADEWLEDPSTDQAELADDSVNYVDDPAPHGYRCELDFGWLMENGFLVPGHENRQQALEFRRVKRPLLVNSQRAQSQEGNPASLIFVTSALPAEGKTFVSLNLALSLAAEVDRSVLLIDGDVAKGDLSRWMGIYDEKGLADLLVEGGGNVEDLILETNVDRMSVMPCGSLRDNLDELFASDLMDDVLQGLAASDPSRVVVVDGPPLLATTEASVLAHHMGQVLFVVGSNETPQSAVEQAVAQLDRCENVSVLLNKATRSEASGYGYGYSYGNYGRPESERLAQASEVQGS